MAVSLASTACARPARTASDATEPGRSEHDRGCLAVTVHPMAEAPTTSGGDPVTAALLYQFTNACAHAVRLDFARASAELVLADGRRVALAPRAVPGARLRGRLEAFDDGTEAVGYRVPESAGDVRGVVASLCVAPSRVEADERADHDDDARICFRRRPDGAYEHAGGVDGAFAGRDATARTIESTVGDDGLWTRVQYEGTVASYADRFGAWQRPPLVVGLGLSTHRLALAHRRVHGADSLGTNAPGSLSAAPLGAAQSVSVDVDVDAFVAGPLYVGGEFQVGGGAFARDATLLDDPHVGVAGGGVYAGVGGVVGVALPRLDRFGARAEIYGGGALLGARFDDVDAPLAQDACDGDGCPSMTISTWVLEPRLRAQAWVTPWLTVDAWGGLGALEAGDWSSGLAITAHLRSFDGAP